MDKGSHGDHTSVYHIYEETVTVEDPSRLEWDESPIHLGSDSSSKCHAT